MQTEIQLKWWWNENQSGIPESQHQLGAADPIDFQSGTGSVWTKDREEIRTQRNGKHSDRICGSNLPGIDQNQKEVRAIRIGGSSFC